MKKILITLALFPILSLSQNVLVDSQTYSPQQLIEDVLIDSNCIENVVVTNVIGGDFNNTDQSYGYFDGSGSSFPFSSGIVLSTGRLQNVEGPNTSLSDDDANNWGGDNDLETILNESSTYNATILEFEFTAIADQISFRYIFASEEYQENNSNTCQYSDLFGFLIRPVNQTQFTNIAVVPNTNTPVKVTTVHSGIPGGCDPINETYFGSWNDSTAPINFNGQTAVLTATADVLPNETYHVKLVIADEQNYRYDSAVFLEAGSFELTTNLGPDRLLATNNPLCENEDYLVDAFQDNATNYSWFKDGQLLTNETNSYLNINEDGIYNVEVTLNNSCISFGEVVIEYASNPVVYDTSLNSCDYNQDNISFFNLWDASQTITNNDSSIVVTSFFTNFDDAFNATNPIENPSLFENTIPFQTVYGRTENDFGCLSVASVQLLTTYNLLILDPFTTCDDEVVDGISTFDLGALQIEISAISPPGAIISFHHTLEDVYLNNSITIGNYTNTSVYSEDLFVKILVNGDCFALTTVTLEVLYTPILENDITNENPIYYCLNTFPESITLYGGVLNDSPSNYYYNWSTGENMSFIEVNTPGTYTVTVTDPNGCSSSRSITVVGSNTATIDAINTIELTENNSVTIDYSGEGNYEFALDNTAGPYQDSNSFNQIQAGFHTVYVRDKNGCGIVSKDFAVLGFPKYFTPNGDSYNDTWSIQGSNALFNSTISVQIFNRYGKLLATIDSNSNGWNGTFNGAALPTDDYWFIAYLENKKQYKGHFTLKR